MPTAEQITAAEDALRRLDSDEDTWPTGEQVAAVIDAALAAPKPVATPDPDDRPETDCGCGFTVVYCGPYDGWQHDAAPYFWGDDHDPQPDADAIAAAAAYDAAHPEED